MRKRREQRSELVRVFSGRVRSRVWLVLDVVCFAVVWWVGVLTLLGLLLDVLFPRPVPWPRCARAVGASSHLALAQYES